jgi:putative ABC transport system permease protein
MRLYRCLLLIFPPAFRARFRDDMADVFADRLRRARAQGRMAVARLWMHALADLAAHGLAERRASRERIRRMTMLQTIAQDLRFAARAFRARPGFTLAALVTLALGIGANTAIFSVVHAVLIRDLPYADADRIVSVYESYRGNRSRMVANPFNFDTWQRQARSFERLSATRRQQATLTGAGEPARIWTLRVDGNFFPIFGVPAMLGRTLTDADAARDAPVAVLSHGFWTRALGADPDALGRTLQLDGGAVAVVGVMPPAFGYPERTDIYRPLPLPPAMRANMDSWFLGVVGKLAPGIAIERAQVELDAIAARLAREHPAGRRDRGAWIVRLQDDLAFRSAPNLRLLQGVVVLVLLIACANVANLLLASASGRRREISIRAALGAGRGRLVRQLVTESVLLSLAGGAIGAACAAWGVEVLVAAAPEFTLPQGTPIAVDGVVLAFTFGLAAATGAAAGLVPAMLFSSPRLADAIKGSGAASAGAGRPAQRLLRSTLVAAEVAISLVLIAASVLLVRSFLHVIAQERGFSPAGVLTATITLSPDRYKNPAAQQAFWNDLLARLRAMPGVTTVGASNALPFSNWEWQTWFEVRGLEAPKNNGVSLRTVTPGYFDALRIQMRAGRPFTDDDVAGAEPVALVNEAFVRRHLAGLAPIGQLVRTERDNAGAGRVTALINARAPQPTTPKWMTIVGVIADTRHTRLEEPASPELYRPLAQTSSFMLVVALRTSGDPAALERPLRAEVARLDANLPLEQVRTMEAAIDRTTAQRRYYMALVTLFAALAVVLALVGTYGVMSYVAGLRRREIGIRLALGATAAGVKALLVRQGLRPVIAGIAVGAAGALWAGALLRDQLFEIEARDPQTIAGAALAFALVGAIACWLPARRSGAVEPVAVLRTE